MRLHHLSVIAQDRSPAACSPSEAPLPGLPVCARGAVPKERHKAAGNGASEVERTAKGARTMPSAPDRCAAASPRLLALDGRRDLLLRGRGRRPVGPAFLLTVWRPPGLPRSRREV